MATLRLTAVVATLAVVLLASETTVAAHVTGSGPAAAPVRKPLRILSIMTVDTMSHHLWMSPLTVALAKRGHLVEAVDVAMPKEVPPTLNVTIIENAFISDRSDPDALKRYVRAGRLEQMALLSRYALKECDRDLVTPTMRRLLDPSYPGEFDLIVLDFLSDCMLGIAHRFNYPGVVLVSPLPGSTFLHDLKGNPDMPALVPTSVVPYPMPMALWQRAATVFYSAYLRALGWWLRAETDAALRNHFGADVPSADQLRRGVHVALVNEDPILDQPRPYVPGLVPVGGMHIQPANASNLPADLREWMDASSTGFIFVSFGSIIKGSHIDEQKKRALLDGISALAEVRVLWKMEPEALGVDKLPDNVRAQKWVPQNDVLGHPKLLLFVSHCGGLSTQESAFHGVPMLGVPIMTDQFLNADKVVRIGMARRMPFAEITKERFVTEVREMLRNPSYRDVAKHTALMLRDQPSSPLDTAVWWCEYVGRHRGAPHLRSPALDLTWPQVMLLDVMALFLLAVLALAAVVALLIKAVLRTAQKMSLHREKKD